MNENMNPTKAERNARVFDMIERQGISYRKVARAEGISATRVQQIVKAARKRQWKRA